MTDPYRLPDQPGDVPAKHGRPSVLWPALVVALVLNALSAIAGWPLPVQIATGILALVCGALLVARSVRRR